MTMIPKKRKNVMVHSFRDEMDNLFDNFFNNSLMLRSSDNDLYSISPKIDIVETKSGFELSAEMPGLAEEDIDINVENSYLTISGKKESKKKEEEKNYICMERSYGSFQRSIRLPENVNIDKIVASFKNGVLHLEIPKKEIKPEAAKKILINRKSPS